MYENYAVIWRSETWKPPFTYPISQGTDIKAKRWGAMDSRISVIVIEAGESLLLKSI